MVLSLHIAKGVGVFLSTALLLSLLPVTADAQRASSSRPAGGGAAFCENVDDMREKALSRVGQKKSNSDRKEAVEGKRNARIEKLEERRAAKDTERDARYDRLRQAADTDAKKVAVETFIDTVKDLAEERKSAVDAAIAVFENTVEELLEERKDAVAEYAGEIEDMLNDIFDDVETSCDADESPAEIRAQLKTDITAMRTTIKNDREKYSFKDELEEARATRAAATEAAKASFQSGLENAKADLKAVFGEG